MTLAIHRSLASARLSLKINRFEVLSMLGVGIALSLWAVWLKLQLDATGFTRECYRSALANSDDSNPCYVGLRTWSEIATGDAGKAMGAALFLPFMIGIALGVPLVGREIEQRTAATAWALAGSRRRWLLGRLVPVVFVVVVLGLGIAVTSEMLSVTRAVGGSTYDDAVFAGFPVLGHAVLGLGVGIFVGAVVGHTLPAFLIAGAIALFPMSAAVGLQASSQPYLNSDFGDANTGQVVDLLDARWDYEFIAPDGRVLSRTEALASVPVGTADMSKWLTAAYEIDSLGIADSVTSTVQLREAATGLVVGLVLLLAALPVVERRRPG